MSGREKVMSWLEGLAEPDWRECYSDSEVQETARQALDLIDELLKEQETIEPTLIREGRNKHYNDYVCPRCDNEVVYEQNYCSECGVQFLWEGEGNAEV